ncbi:MAG: ribbon-helix-helix domain-containing protein [Aquabacterium sp.]|nr:ribbon-helix-helix domain-containing protein [Aquabacterium sp.]
MRINARLDDEAQQQIDYLTITTGQSVSQVVRESVARYYRAVHSDQGGLRHFAQAIGAGDSGRSDTATRYKELLAESLAAKHGLTPDLPPGPLR